MIMREILCNLKISRCYYN